MKSNGIEKISKTAKRLEFQAIRYAASYATINSVDLVKRVYAPYIEKYQSEFELGELTSYELGPRKLNKFLRTNNGEKDFNKKQKIILVASDYDEQTLSAVAWLNSNKVDICCFKLTPYKIGGEIYLNTEKLLPPTNYDNFYVNLMDKTSSVLKTTNSTNTRRVLPKIDALLDWGVVKEGDIIVPKDRYGEGILLSNGNISVGGKETSLQIWLKEIYGWSSIQTYAFAVHKESGKTLSQLREEYMNDLATEVVSET